MAERPILFSAPMVRAILDGRKTQTRRALKHQPIDIIPMPAEPAREWVILEQRDPEPKGKVIRCRFGVPGDLLWVRETHYVWSAGSRDGATEPEAPCTWTPSIHMPRWASRITLRVTDVRVERLHDIEESDAEAEGVDAAWGNVGADALPLYVEGFKRIWAKINGEDSWATNPWVWVVSFERMQPNSISGDA
jgi:hypothetical protein